MIIRDIMTSDPVRVEPDTTLEEIATLMKEEDIGAVPVVEDGELCGIVTDRDIVVRCVAEGKDTAECTADEVMSAEVQSLGPDVSVDEAARLMSDRQIRRLPIVENKRLVGMVSLGDLAVKSHDDDLSGDTLEDVSKGVKQSSAGRSVRSARAQAPARPQLDRKMTNEEAAASAEPFEAETQDLMGGRTGTDRSLFKPVKQRPLKQSAAPPSRRQEQGLRSDPSPRKQGIANHSAQEENARNDKVIPFRKENEVRNTRVQKPTRRKTAS
jgi:CBS domain-containing protein